MPTRPTQSPRPPAAGANSASDSGRNGTSPHTAAVRHSIGNAAQRSTPGRSDGPADGGDWLAERVLPTLPSMRSKR